MYAILPYTNKAIKSVIERVNQDPKNRNNFFFNSFVYIIQDILFKVNNALIWTAGFAGLGL